MKKRYNERISQLTICVSTISSVICAEFLDIKPNWLNIVVSVLISLMTSFGVIYFLLGGIVRLIYNKIADEFHLAGIWYIVYYSNFKEDNYLRIGKLVLNQEYEQINIEKLNAHSPEIQNNEIVCKKYRDYEESETPSTGVGFGKLNTKDRTFTGVYYITRSSQQTAVGLFHCRINDKVREMSGEFTTTEPSRPNNKPVGGKLILFKEEKAQLEFCNNLIKKAKEQ